MFEIIDDLISDWAQSNSLQWASHHRDAEVRSIDLPLADGRIAQLWIEPGENGNWTVRAWDRESQSLSLSTPKTQLADTLTRALAIIRSWHQHEA